MVSKLEPYELPGKRLALLQQCFCQQADPESIAAVYTKRPKESELRTKITGELSMSGYATHHPAPVMEAVLRSVARTWDKFHEASVSPSDFVRTPNGASYEIVNIAGKGRGIIASRDIKAGETILEEAPVLVLPPESVAILIFLTLPREALEAILLLYNEHPGVKRLSAAQDIPVHRLVDLLQGILNTNAFGTHCVSCGNVGVLLLTGSLFNHSDNANVTRQWDDATEKMVFTSERDIKVGEELVLDYVPGMVGLERVERLRGYGILEI
ncbi:hypothetical protein LSUE1_G007789 [Lachnellula suecica]|uniref:SET domain-containing protein n=1 Tax=Lachnellula suecica TaxID=602035 RepID=A0A8T9C7C9_9HELO|nr:hypothetical protein LSUE1_G007789 [Lachnellula suecica]